MATATTTWQLLRELTEKRKLSSLDAECAAANEPAIGAKRQRPAIGEEQPRGTATEHATVDTKLK